jgi:hypothetical protein
VCLHLGEKREMKTKWLVIGVTVDGRQTFSEELGELTAEEITAKSTVAIKEWCAIKELCRCWLFYEQDNAKGSGMMLRSRPTICD